MRGLEGGADYNLSKPFQTPELIACLRAITRRKSDKPLMRLCFGGIELQQESVSLLCARTGQSVKLGAKEYQLLELFLRNPRQVLPRETIVECVWGFDNEAEYNKSGGLPVLCAPQAAIRRLDRGNSRHARRGLRIGGGRMLETLRRRLTWLVIGILVLISAGLIASTGTDENALLVTGGNVTVTDSKLVRESADSTGGDSASFYGVGAAALVTGGTLTIETAEISTDAEGGAGVFACGSGVATVKNTVISTRRGTSGGIHVAGGTLYAENLTVTTEGASSAAIRSDRGGGTMVVNGGSYTASGFGSPAVYVTADISISDATLTATGSEALCLEGKNSVTLTNCTLTGSLPDLEQNDNTWTVILYQSMSGDSEVGKGTFTMTGGTLISNNGGLFYTTNTDSEFTLRNVTLQASAESEYLLRCTGNANGRGWGSTGSNGANCVFTAAEQQMSGRVLWDSVSNLMLSLTEGTSFTGAILDDESCAGEGGSGTCALTIDETSEWIVTENSMLTTLTCKGRIADAAGRTVTVTDPSGSVLVSGESDLTITVSEYIAE